MTTLDPERPYTPYQRRQVIEKIASSDGTNVIEASEKFRAMEFQDADAVAELCLKFDESPKKDES